VEGTATESIRVVGPFTAAGTCGELVPGCTYISTEPLEAKVGVVRQRQTVGVMHAIPIPPPLVAAMMRIRLCSPIGVVPSGGLPRVCGGQTQVKQGREAARLEACVVRSYLVQPQRFGVASGKLVVKSE
jgi:hypothetical protein